MLDRIYDGISRFIIKRSRIIIAGVIVLTVIGAAFITQLHFENDMTFWVDKTSGIGRLPHYINERFGSNTPLLIAVDCGDVFTPVIMGKLDEFALELEKLPGVEEQISLTTVDDVTSTEDGIRVAKLVQLPLPADPGFFTRLRDKVLAGKEYAGKIVSRDGSVAFIVIRPKFGQKSDQVGREVKSIAKRIFASPGERLYFSGNPYLMDSMAAIVLGDFKFLIPIVSLLVLAILFLSFRTARGVALPLVTVLISAALAMGVMAALRVPLNILSSAMPVILIAVGSAYGIHVLNNYYENAGSHADPKEIVRLGIREVGLPVLMAGLTTIAGFISNITADVTVIKTFGLFTAIGVFLAMLIALFFIPAVLLHMKVPAGKKRAFLSGETEDAAAGKIAKVIARFFLKHKYAAIAAFSLAAIGIFLFSFRIEPKVDILGYFGKDSEPNAAARFVSSRFGGFSPLSAYLKADMQDPDVLKLALMLEEKMKAYGNLSVPSGAPDVVCQLNDAMTGVPAIPETKKEVQELWFFTEGKKTLESMVTKEKDEGLVTVFLPGFDSQFVGGLIAYLEAFIGGYRGGFGVAENTPGNPYLAGLEGIMIANVLGRNGAAPSSSEVDAVVSRLGRICAQTESPPDEESLVRYCTGDEAEILLSEAESKALYRRLTGLKVIVQRDVRDAVLGVLSGSAPSEDVDALARSILTITEEANTKAKLRAMADELAAAFPAVEKTPDSEIAYALAPYLWKTIPVPNAQNAGAAPTLIRTAGLEDIRLTGSAYLIEDIRKSVFNNQMASIAVALGAVLLLNCLTFGSILEGIISLCAIVFTIMVNFGIMGIFKIPLDFVTAIIASVTIGTGIDYTIHFITRYSRELKNNGGDMQAAYAVTLATTGKAIVFNALSVGLGFAVLLGSNVIPMRTAGLLLAITMLTSSVSAMTFLPAVLAATRIVQKKRPGKSKPGTIHEEA
jgi:predicted RND superfamily exporter protein